MVAALLIGMALTVAQPGLAEEERAKYELAAQQAGRDPEAHVKLALWCEAHGLNAERIKHLAIAVLNDPKNVMARGLMGLVVYKGEWELPDDVGQKINSDASLAATLSEYATKRDKTPSTAEAQWRLALWCEEKGLREEARAHLRNVVQLEPKREGAWKRLGYKQRGKAWVLEADLAAEKEDRELQKRADRHWKPLLEKWRGWLRDKRKQSEAETALAEVVDPRSVPMVWMTFATGTTDNQLIAAQVLSQIDAATASRGLAALAAFSEAAPVRRVATEALRHRDPREFAGALVALIRDPIKFEVRPVNGPGEPGELFIIGKKSDLKRVYNAPAAPDIRVQPGDSIWFDEFGYPVVRKLNGPPIFTAYMPYQQVFTGSVFNPADDPERQALLGFMKQSALGSTGRVAVQNALDNRQQFIANSANHGLVANNAFAAAALGELALRPPGPFTKLSFRIQNTLDIPVGQMEQEVEKSARSLQQQLDDDVKKLEAYNNSVREYDGRILPILRQAASQDLGEEREPWDAWFTDLMGYRILAQQSQEKSVVVEEVSPSYQPQPIEAMPGSFVSFAGRLSCFAAGTLVRTRTGSQPIEKLKVGDVVLTQNVKTGALGYQPIVVIHHNPPSKTYRITAGKETIVSSAFHRFWKAGKGWVMARDLKPGDTLRTLGGLVEVDTLQIGPAEPVFNLDVAVDNDFFVGRSGALVHDNTLPDLRLAPFDAAPVLAASTRSAK